MPDDLRIGLVEAVAEVLYLRDFPNDEWDAVLTKHHYLRDSEAAVDRMLGFLNDNADTPSIPVEDEDGVVRLYGPLNVHAARLITALSDTRDTGEKP